MIEIAPPPIVPLIPMETAALCWANHIALTRTEAGEIQITFEPRDFEILRRYFAPQEL